MEYGSASREETIWVRYGGNYGLITVARSSDQVVLRLSGGAQLERLVLHEHFIFLCK